MNTPITNAHSGDDKQRAWNKVCAEVIRAHQKFKRIDGQVTWLIAYVRGSLPIDPPVDQQDGPSAE